MNPQPKPDMGLRARRAAGFWFGLLVVSFGGWSASGVETSATADFHRDVQPILKEYCYDCHGDGAKKGHIAFDELTTDESLLNHDLWFKVLKNVRGGLMPPQKKPRPNTQEQQKLERWIKYGAFGIDPEGIPIRAA